MGWLEDLTNSIGQTPVVKGLQGAFNFLDTAPNRPDKLNKRPVMQQESGFGGGGGSFAKDRSNFGGSGGSFGNPMAPAMGSWRQDITGQGSIGMPEPEMSAREKAYLEAIEAIRRKTEEQYAYDGANDALVDQAFQGSLDAINGARTKTNDNYGQSRTMLDNLTNSHVANIKGADRDAVNRIGDELTSGYNKIYDDRNAELSADRDREMATKVEMLQRLGIQDAGLGTAGAVQTAAIADNSGDKQGALQQAGAYKAADLTRNTELGQNQAAMGVDRQSDLRRQLDGILGGLDKSEADVRNQMSQAKLEGRNADRASWDDMQRYNNETLLKLQQQESDQANADSDRAFQREMAGLKSGGSAKGSSSMFDVVGGQLQNSTGYDMQPYLAAYSQAMEAGGGALGVAGGDKASYLVQQMRKKNPQLDPQVAVQYVQGLLNYGTDKLSASSQY